jgi:fucose permease
VWLQIAIFFVYTGLEAGAGAWCFTLLRARGLPVAAAGAWTTAYWGTHFVARVTLGFVVDRIGPDRLLRASTALALAGATAFALDGGLVGRLGLALLGAGLAPVFPTLMARTPARLGDAWTAHAVGFQVSAATLGVAAFPAGIGVLVGRIGAPAIGAAVVVQAAALLGLHEALHRATRR